MIVLAAALAADAGAARAIGSAATAVRAAK
jgi:hypothetical protein